MSRWRQRPLRGDCYITAPHLIQVVCGFCAKVLLLLLPSTVTERDVSRTDRHNTFFSGNDNPGLTLLHDVLMTYCMYNFDLGVFLESTQTKSPDERGTSAF